MAWSKRAVIYEPTKRILLSNLALLLGPLALKDDALELFKNGKLLVGVINLGITLFFADQEANFFKSFQLALDVSCVFLNKLGKTANMRLEVWVLSIDNNYLAANS